MSVPPYRVGFIHIVSVVSRSGRAAAEIGCVDLDETVESVDEIGRRLADAVYRRGTDQEMHRDLASAVAKAILTVEEKPGQPAEAEADLPDGRRVRVIREIG